jgi:N-acetylglutamate synthase
VTGPLDADHALRSATAQTWPAIEREQLGEWQLRASRGYTGRANSVLVSGDPGCPIADAAARAVAFYRSRELPVLAQIVVGSAGERALADLGWVEARPAEADCWVMTRSILPDGPVERSDGVELADLTDEWLAAKFPAGVPDGAAEVMGGGQSIVAGVRAADSTIIAVGRASVAAGHVGISALWVAPCQRRKGIGTRLVTGLTAWGRDQGACTAFLEVLGDNERARAAYRKSGFVDRYAYRYLTTPVPVHSGSLPLPEPSMNGDSTPS